MSRDIDVITAIYSEHVLGGTASFDTVPRSTIATLEKLQECNARGWPFLSAEKDKSVIGYAYVTQFRDRPAYRYTCENSIYLRGDMRGQRIGTALLQRLMAAAELCGFRQMIAVCGGGEAASVALHQSNGFRLAGRMTSVGRKAGRWLDTVYLQASLGAGDSTPPEQEPA
jgi:phosphinothricin acetyltransferase